MTLNRAGVLVLGSLIVIPLAITFVIVLLGYRQRCRLLSLQQGTEAELRLSISQLASRHLIVSHLADSLPSSSERYFNRTHLTETRQQAERSLAAINPSSPDLSSIRQFSAYEQDFVEMVDALLFSVQNDDAASEIQSVAGCLEGLAKANKEICDAVSIYNASAITYMGYVESSALGKFISTEAFGLFDLSPHSSNLSQQDRAAS